MNAETFNSRYPVGTPVFAYPGVRPEDGPTIFERLVTRTRSNAQVLGGHTDVVWVDDHGACIALSHVDVVTEAEHEAAKLAAAVAELGALPMPAGPVLRNSSVIPLPSNWSCAYGASDDEPFCTDDGDEHVCPTIRVHRDDAEQFAALVARVHELEDELAKYVGKEPTIADEMAYLGRCLNAVHDLCGEQEKAARLFELPVPEWVETVRRVADGGAR